MEISELTIRLIILIIPGIIASLIVETLTIHKKWSSFQFAIYAILLGFISYGTYQVFLYLYGIKNFLCGASYNPKMINLWVSLFDKSVPISITEVLITCIFSVVIGFIASGFIQHKVLSRIARKINVSNKYGEEDLYTHFLNSSQIQWIWLRDRASGLTYEGDVESFSENEIIQEIKLRDVKVFSSEDSTYLYSLSAIYLSAPPGQFIIEIPKDEKEETNGEKNNQTNSN